MNEYVVAITSYCDTKEKIDILTENVSYIRKNYTKFDIALHANFPLSDKHQKLFDHYFYSNLNILSKNSRVVIWKIISEFNEKFNYIINDYGFSVLSQIKVLSEYLLKYKRIFLINYDIILENNYFDNFINYFYYDIVLYSFGNNYKSANLILMNFNPYIFNKISNQITLDNYEKSFILAEEKFFNIIKGSNLNFKILPGENIKDKINILYHIDIAEKNDFFNKIFISYDNNILAIYIWDFYINVIKNITIKIKNREFKLINYYDNDVFKSQLNYYEKINEIYIIKIDNNDVNIKVNTIMFKS